MNQKEINELEEYELQNYKYLKDIDGYNYEITNIVNAANKSKSTILRKLQSQKIIDELGKDLKETKNNRGNKKFLFTLNGVRKLVSIIHNVSFEQIKNMSISDMQKLTQFNENEPIQSFKNENIKKSGKNWIELQKSFENNIEPIIIEQRETIANLKNEIRFMNEDFKHNQFIIESQNQRITDLEEINDLLREKIDMVYAYHQKKDTNK
ncbi:hypothetical protein [Staphylococcus warneri]|uniref:hypothetical protein n=1 Tax=Staphylococcus warneri TaxID=1292 RepID=UPI00167774C3|nr:hypothetical protein [Staphylococcus warneri]